MDTLVREEVRERYAGIAQTKLRGRTSSCCGDGAGECCSPSDTIPLNALAALHDAVPLPSEIIQTSLGCGTPLELAALQPGETVLDLGSGGGLDCFYAAKLVGPRGHVIGVDMTPEMLQLANTNREQVGLHNVEFRRGYLEALPVADACDCLLAVRACELTGCDEAGIDSFGEGGVVGDRRVELGRGEPVEGELEQAPVPVGIEVDLDDLPHIEPRAGNAGDLVRSLAADDDTRDLSGCGRSAVRTRDH